MKVNISKSVKPWNLKNIQLDPINSSVLIYES